MFCSLFLYQLKNLAVDYEQSIQNDDDEEENSAVDIINNDNEQSDIYYLIVDDNMPLPNDSSPNELVDADSSASADDSNYDGDEPDRYIITRNVDKPMDEEDLEAITIMIDLAIRMAKIENLINSCFQILLVMSLFFLIFYVIIFFKCFWKNKAVIFYHKSHLKMKQSSKISHNKSNNDETMKYLLDV